MGYIGPIPAQVPLTSSDIEDGIITADKLATDSVETVKVKDVNITAGKLAATQDLSSKTITLPATVAGLGTGINVTNQITGVVPAANLGTGTASATTYLAGDGSYKALSEYDDNQVQSNIAMLGFKVATNGSLVRYNLVDQSIDEFNDTSGVDASASTNESRSAGAPYYYYGESSSSSSFSSFGDGSDGALTTSGNVTHTVLNKSGSYDGDMLIKQYTDLNIQSGHTMTVDQPCRGMMILCTGDCTIAGTLTMNNKGAYANPTASGGSDSNAVSASGLQIGLATTSGTSTLDNATANFNGCGTAVRTVVNGLTDISSSGTIFTIPRIGGVGNIGGDQSGSGTLTGATGGTVSGGPGGGGAGGGDWDTNVLSTTGYVSAGGDGSCFVGGSGGGAISGTNGQSVGTITATNATDYGGVGGVGTGQTGHGNYCAEGGMGNPTGAGFCAGAVCSSCDTTGGVDGRGGGGLIWLIVKGDLTVTGTISSNGGTPDAAGSNQDASGSSGGGVIVYNYAGTLSSSGTIQAIGGLSVSPSGTGKDGGAGGAGSVQTAQVLHTKAIDTPGADLTLQSTDVTAGSAPTYGEFVTLIENAYGTATLNTDIKGYVSRDSGTTFTQGTLVDEGTWGTNKKILGFHDLDISAQPSGTSMCYKIETLNQSESSKETRIYASSIGWR